jgi:hypothetical protein
MLIFFIKNLISVYIPFSYNAQAYTTLTYITVAYILFSHILLTYVTIFIRVKISHIFTSFLKVIT